MVNSFPSEIAPRILSPTFIRPNERVDSSPYSGAGVVTRSPIMLFAFDFEFPPLDEGQYNQAIAILTQPQEIVVEILRAMQPNYYGNNGALVASGSSGFNLNLSNVFAPYEIKAGRFLSIKSGNRYYLYKTATGAAAGLGTRSISLTGIIRTPPNIGDEVLLERPKMQGIVLADSIKTTLTDDGFYSLSFKLSEVQ